VLDLAKAFDKLNFYGLFLKLMDNSTPVCLIKILESWYARGEVVVRWGSALSSPTKLLAGVRQGGVLSPTLFSVYINVLIVKLKKSGLGCYIHGIYMGCLLYADDVLLLSTTLLTMQKMLDVCVCVMSDIDMCFNVKKSCAIRFGKRFNKVCVPLSLGGLNLDYCSRVNYLGVVLKSAVRLSFDFDKNCIAFYRALNKLLNRCKFSKSELVCAFLIQNICVPILTYAIEVVTISSSMIRKLDNMINNVIRRVFNVCDRENIMCVRQNIGLLSLDIVRKKRTFKYLTNLSKKHLSFCDIIYRGLILDDLWLSHFVRSRYSPCRVNDFMVDIRRLYLELDCSV
jgi:hypothetical protein